MSKAPEFVRTNRPFLEGEGVFPDNDPVFCPIAIPNEERDASVRQMVEYRGFLCKQRAPHNHWIVFATADGSELPADLSGQFTNHITLRAAINEHLAAKERVQS